MRNERRLADGRVELVDTRRVEASPLYNRDLAPVPLGGSVESETRKELFRTSASGAWQMADPDGNWLDISSGGEARQVQ